MFRDLSLRAKIKDLESEVLLQGNIKRIRKYQFDSLTREHAQLQRTLQDTRPGPAATPNATKLNPGSPIFVLNNSITLMAEFQEATNTIQDQRQLADTTKQIRHRFFVTPQVELADRTAMYHGNRAAHDGNIVLDVSLFRHGMFSVGFMATYNERIENWLSPDPRSGIMHQSVLVQKVRNSRATLVQRKSFSARTLSYEHDCQFLVLERQFNGIVDSITIPDQQWNLDSHAELQMLQMQMNDLMLLMIKWECRTEIDARAQGTSTLRLGWGESSQRRM